MIADEVILIAQVVVAFTLAFVLVPLLIMPRIDASRSTLDDIVVNFIRWVAIIIVATHILSVIGLYNGVTIATLLLAIGWFARFRREIGGMPGLLQRIWPTGGKPPPRRTRRVRPSWRHGIVIAGLSLPVVAVFGGSYWLRVRDAIGTYTLAPPDAYIHMTWARDIAANNIWSDGVYPQGMAAFTAFVNLFAPFTHLHDVARFLGPLLGTLVVVAVYYAVVRLTRSPGAALVAAGAFGFFSAAPEWRIPWHRQIGLLSQELAVVIAILALPVAVLAVTERSGGATLELGQKARMALGGHSLTLGAAGIAIGLTHPIPGVAFVLLVSVGSLAPALVDRARFPQAFGVIVTAIGSFVIGSAVQPIAELLGPGAYLGDRSMDRITGLADRSDTVLSDLLFFFGDVEVLGHSWLSLLAGICAIVGIGLGFRFARSPRWGETGAQILALGAVGLAVVVLWDVRIMAQVIPTFYVARLANVFAPLLALAIGAGLGALTPLIADLRPIATGRRVLIVPAVGLVVGIVALGGLATRFPAAAIEAHFERDTIEYEAMPGVTRSIRRSFDRGTYTIVGLTHQRPLIAGDGFFIELWVFARDAPEVAPDEIVPIPTTHTFIFVEKEPFDIEPLDRPGPTEEYYYDTDKRGRVMAATYAWAEERLRADPETQIHYDDERLRVYRISRNPAIRVDFERTDLFQDYTYQPGELFNEGPTRPRDVEIAGDG